MTGTFRRVVVTGGTGFLGSVACRMLREDGTSVVSVGIPPASASREPAVDSRYQDITEPFDVDGPVDLVLHLASPASPADRYPLCALEAASAAVHNALRLAEAKGARFVLASTSEVYIDPVGPRSVHDESKRYAEALTAAYGRAGRADTGIARLFNSYGPGMRPGDGRMVPTFARQALRGDPVTVTGDGSQTRSLCYATDAVRGLLLLAASDLPGPVNIGNPDETTVGEIATRIITLAGSSSPVRFVPSPARDPRIRKPDITMARVQLGFEPQVGWREGLRSTLEWFRRAGRAHAR